MKKTQKKKSVCLLSGGLDSATTLYYAKDKGFEVHALIFSYGQRHAKETRLAERIAVKAKVPYEIVRIALPWQGSSLLDKKAKLPERAVINEKEIPSTYVPARNIIFLSFAASFAESIGASDIFIGANAVDYSGYPDCRPEFFDAFRQTLKKGLKTGVKGRPLNVNAPLIRKTKAQIIRLGLKLKVPYALTWSCYQGGRHPCGKCDSCRLRQKGFDETGVKDPAL